MQIQIEERTYEKILPLRNQFLQEHQMQIRYDSCHYRGWADSYVFVVDGNEVGYGSIKGKDDLKERDTVFEFFLLPTYRKKSPLFFKQLLQSSTIGWIESQSNVPLLTSMLFEFCSGIHSEVILFADKSASNLVVPGAILSKWDGIRDVFGKEKSEVGQYILELDGEIVADGGFLTHYNYPFVDLYMEVHPDHRGKGYASYILQEVKKECYKAGRIPAARCNISNPASKYALLNAGMQVSGYMLTGKIDSPSN